MIIISGDSFTCNDCDFYPEQEFIDMGYKIEELKYPLPRYTSWPQLLEKELNTSVINTSRGGMGNYFICKTASDAIVKNHKDIKFCIVALSGWHRMETTRLRYSDSIKNIKSDEDLHIIFNNTFRSLYELQLVCKEFNIPLVFFNMLNPLPFPIYEKKVIQNVLNILIKDNYYFKLIDTKYAIGWPFIIFLGGYDFWSKYLSKNKTKFSIGNMQKLVQQGKKELKYYYDNHPNQYGHNVIYEKVIEQLKKFKLI